MAEFLGWLRERCIRCGGNLTIEYEDKYRWKVCVLCARRWKVEGRRPEWIKGRV